MTAASAESVPAGRLRAGDVITITEDVTPQPATIRSIDALPSGHLIHLEPFRWPGRTWAVRYWDGEKAERLTEAGWAA